MTTTPATDARVLTATDARALVEVMAAAEGNQHIVVLRTDADGNEFLLGGTARTYDRYNGSEFVDSRDARDHFLRITSFTGSEFWIPGAELVTAYLAGAVVIGDRARRIWEDHRDQR